MWIDAYDDGQPLNQEQLERVAVMMSGMPEPEGEVLRRRFQNDQPPGLVMAELRMSSETYAHVLMRGLKILRAATFGPQLP